VEQAWIDFFLLAALEPEASLRLTNMGVHHCFNAPVEGSQQQRGGECSQHLDQTDQGPASSDLRHGSCHERQFVFANTD
jgi:hypothetical protein